MGPVPGRACLRSESWQSDARPQARPSARNERELPARPEHVNDGRGWVRTNGLSRVKGDEEDPESGVNPVDKHDSGDGG